MSIFSNLGKIFAKGSKVESKALKTASSDVIKTTSKFTGSDTKLISGGQSVLRREASNFTQGVSGVAKVGGKVIATTGILAIPAAAGLYGYDKLKQTIARTPEYYQTQDQNNAYSQETENLKNRIKVLEEAQDQGIDQPSPIYTYLGGGSTSPSDESKSPVSSVSPYAWIFVGVAVLGIGAYAYTKRRK